jgi:hypothetical protein
MSDFNAGTVTWNAELRNYDRVIQQCDEIERRFARLEAIMGKAGAVGAGVGIHTPSSASSASGSSAQSAGVAAVAGGSISGVGNFGPGSLVAGNASGPNPFNPSAGNIGAASLVSKINLTAAAAFRSGGASFEAQTLADLSSAVGGQGTSLGTNLLARSVRMNGGIEQGALRTELTAASRRGLDQFRTDEATRSRVLEEVGTGIRTRALDYASRYASFDRARAESAEYEAGNLDTLQSASDSFGLRGAAAERAMARDARRMYRNRGRAPRGAGGGGGGREGLFGTGYTIGALGAAYVAFNGLEDYSRARAMETRFEYTGGSRRPRCRATGAAQLSRWRGRRGQLPPALRGHRHRSVGSPQPSVVPRGQGILGRADGRGAA